MDTKTRRYEMRARKDTTQATRDAIVAAAMSTVVAERSLAITLGSVADRAGVTVKTVLRHFGNREALIDAAWARGQAEVLAERMVPPGEPARALAVLIEHYEERGEWCWACWPRRTTTPRAHAMCERRTRAAPQVGGRGLRRRVAGRARRAVATHRCAGGGNRCVLLEATAPRPWSDRRRGSRPDAVPGGRRSRPEAATACARRQLPKGPADEGSVCHASTAAATFPRNWPLPEALRSRGAEVRFLGHQGIRDRVQSAGFEFESFTTGSISIQLDAIHGRA